MKGTSRIAGFFYRVGEEACTESSVTSRNARGHTRTTGLEGQWAMGKFTQGSRSPGKQGNESGEAVSGSQPLTWGLLTGPENPGGAGGGRPGDPMEELMTGKGEPSGGGGIGGGGGAPEPPRDAAAEGGKGGPGGEGGAAPWGRGFGEELSGLRESGEGYTQAQTHTDRGDKKRK